MRLAVILNRKIVSTNVWGNAPGNLVTPLLAQSLTVPTLALLGEGPIATYLHHQVHVFHVLKNSIELIIRGSCDFFQACEVHLSISLQMLSYVELTDSS